MIYDKKYWYQIDEDTELFRVILINKMKESNMSISELSRVSGIELSSLYSYVKGKRIPPLDKFLKLCDILELTPDEIYSLGEFK